MKLLTDSYQADLLGVLSCYDRIVILHATEIDRL